MKLPMLFIMLVLIGCADEKKESSPVFDFTTFTSKKTLSGSIVELDGLTMPSRICIVADKLLLVDTTQAAIASVYDLKTGSLRGRFLHKGEKPSEAYVIDHITVDAKEHKITLQDGKLDKLLVYDFAALDNPQDVLPRKVIPLCKGVTQNISLNDSMMICLAKCSGAANKIILTDTLGNCYISFAPYPIPSVDNIPIEYNGYRILKPHIVINNDKDRVAVFYETFSQIEIYSMDGSLLSEKIGPSPIFAKCSIESNGKKLWSEPIENLAMLAYFHAKSRGDNIWVMYNGGLKNKYPKCKYILIFDWEGLPETCYRIEEGLIDFDVDFSENILYTLNREPNGKYSVRKYTI